MSAANLIRTFVSRFVPLSLLSAVLILAFAPPAVAATKLVAPEKAIKLGNAVSPSPAVKNPSSAATGALRILLVDDDWSDNNNYPGDSRLSPSDRVFRKLVSDAVGGDASSWEIEAVKPYASGPGIERLRKFSLILWYTGSNYGGNPDNSSVLSIEDEKTVRRYLEETGGAVILISPGYVSKVLQQGSTWEQASWPFLNVVLGIRGGQGLAQRSVPATVKATDGTQFHVGKGDAAVETQYSAVNPVSATVVFTAALDAMKSAGQATPVATAFSYGKGRIIYVGFTFENLAANELAPAFRQLLSASGAAAPAAASSAALVTDAPQAFNVTGSGHDSFNFSASSAGAIRVQVQSQGVPVTVAVLHPDGRMVEHTGTGGFVFDDVASDADLVKGHIWAVTVRAAAMTANTAVAASGSVVISHPPSNRVAVQAQLDTLPARTQVLKTARINSATLKQSSIGAPIAPAPMMDPQVVLNPGGKKVKVAPPPPPPPPPPLAGPDPVLRLDKLTGCAGTMLKASGKDLFPPGTLVQLVKDKWGGPDYYNAELHFVYGSQVIIAPMTANETSYAYSDPHPNETETDPTVIYYPQSGTAYFNTVPAKDVYERWYTGVVPTIPVTEATVVTVYLKTKDGRPSNRMNFTYQPQPLQPAQGMFDEFLFVWRQDDHLKDATMSSNYPNIATNEVNLGNGRASRDTFLLGFSGYDTFHNTLELKNGWTVKECHLFIHSSMGSGAEVTECRVGTSSPFVKVRWYLDPTFVLPNDLTYSVRLTITGPSGTRYNWPEK